MVRASHVRHTYAVWSVPALRAHFWRRDERSNFTMAVARQLGVASDHTTCPHAAHRPPTTDVGETGSISIKVICIVLWSPTSLPLRLIVIFGYCFTCAGSVILNTCSTVSDTILSHIINLGMTVDWFMAYNNAHFGYLENMYMTWPSFCLYCPSRNFPPRKFGSNSLRKTSFNRVVLPNVS